MMRDLTGETESDFLNLVKARAIELYADEDQGYQKAISIYERVDSADRLLEFCHVGNRRRHLTI